MKENFILWNIELKIQRNSKDYIIKSKIVHKCKKVKNKTYSNNNIIREKYEIYIKEILNFIFFEWKRKINFSVFYLRI